MSPREPDGRTSARDAVNVTVEQVVAVLDDGGVFVDRSDVGRGAGAGGTLERCDVVVDVVVARLVSPARFHGTALVHQDDAAFTDTRGQRVAVGLHVLRRCYQNVVAPEPGFSAAPVVADDVVADDRRQRDLVKDPGATGACGDVVLVEGVAAFDVTPQAGAVVVMHIVAPQDDAFAGRQLDAAGFPTGQE